MARIIAFSSGSRGGLDDDYTLYDNGEVLNEYDRHIYPGGQNLSRILKAEDLNTEVKERLITAASEENKVLVKQFLKVDN